LEPIDDSEASLEMLHNYDEESHDLEMHRQLMNETEVRRHNEIYAVYRDQVMNGEYDKQRDLLGEQILNALMFITFDLFMMYLCGY